MCADSAARRWQWQTRMSDIRCNATRLSIYIHIYTHGAGPYYGDVLGRSTVRGRARPARGRIVVNTSFRVLGPVVWRGALYLEGLLFAH